MRVFALAAALAAIWPIAASAQSATAPPDVIRVSLDGAGPSHIFRIGPPAAADATGSAPSRRWLPPRRSPSTPPARTPTWLMLESSSSCDGVCWTVYDPSFFNAWGMYRAAGRSDIKCPEKSDRRDVAKPQRPDATCSHCSSPFVGSDGYVSEDFSLCGICADRD